MGSELQNELAETRANAGEALPAKTLEVFSAELARTEQDTDPAKFAPVGSTLADFALPDARGGTTTLAGLVADGPAVLVFYRGAWCPYCNVALRAYQRDLLPELTRRGVRMAAISPQSPDGSLSMKEANALEYAVLSDVGNVVARGLGITFRASERLRSEWSGLGLDLGKLNGTGEWELPHPAVVVVGEDRAIRYLDVRPDYTTRTEPSDVLAALG